MLRGAQASRDTSPRAPRIASTLIPVVIVATLCGCAAGGFGLSKAEIDPSITTGAVNNTAPANPEQRSDEATVRNAVSSADIELLKSRRAVALGQRRYRLPRRHR